MPDEPVVGSGPQSHVGISDSPLEPVGYQQITDLSAPAKALTIPSGGAQVACIIVESQDVRWRDDGTDPIAAVGMPQAKEQAVTFTGNLAALRFIQQIPGAILNISYYRY